jgi:hypothetical protein
LTPFPPPFPRKRGKGANTRRAYESPSLPAGRDLGWGQLSKVHDSLQGRARNGLFKTDRRPGLDGGRGAIYFSAIGTPDQGEML